MNILRTIRLNALIVANAVASVFDSGVDGAIAAFERAEARLARYQDRLDDRITREMDLQELSYDRQAEAARRERAVREASRARADELVVTQARAARIRQRIAKLLD